MKPSDSPGKTKRPPIIISVGCPSGVGPEVAVAAAARSPDACCVLVGDDAVIRRAATVRRVSPRRLVPVSDARAIRTLDPGCIGVWTQSAALADLPPFGSPNSQAGAAQLAWIDQAMELVSTGVGVALVTGPVSKAAIAHSGAPRSAKFLGHTEYLAERLGVANVVMAFWGEALTTALVTTHLPLRKVPDAITPEGVAETTYWLGRLLSSLGKRTPRIVVAALNPHAGEGGLLGDEEAIRIIPGIELARARLANAEVPVEITGPLGAETAIRLTAKGLYDGVVTMYHDQATIPCKLLGFGEAVNVTLGLPIIRTSVDHGTAYDLAGTGKADPSGMRQAIGLAVRLSHSHRALEHAAGVD